MSRDGLDYLIFLCIQDDFFRSQTDCRSKILYLFRIYFLRDTSFSALNSSSLLVYSSCSLSCSLGCSVENDFDSSVCSFFITACFYLKNSSLSKISVLFVLRTTFFCFGYNSSKKSYIVSCRF